MIIVDTTVWIDYFSGVNNVHVNWLDQRLTGYGLGLTDLILCELLQGARDEKMFREVQHQMSYFPVFNTGGQDLAIASARNYRLLRARGVTVRKTIDCVIATYCIGSGHSLLHRDRDFDPFEQHLGLRVVHPPTH
jgi:predicted nucleic acid-binding protein